VHGRQPPVLVDQDIDVRADGIAHRLDYGDRALFVLFRDPAAP
jgi:hypothetical protein